jgi:hypothetical protein
MGCAPATPNPDDGEVLAYLCAYHEAEEGCGCAGEVYQRLGRSAPRPAPPGFGVRIAS